MTDCAKQRWVVLLVWLLAIGTPACSTAASSGSAIGPIERHVAETPPEAMASVKALGSYLAASSSDEKDKTRAIYLWIIQNIDYDVAALASGDLGNQTAERTLKRRKGVCSGYARLFEALAREAGLEAVEVIGFSRGAEYVAGAPLSTEPDHAWTAVRIDGEWRLMDCTWAAGYLDGDSFVRRPEDHYFLTAPDRFVYDHFPSDPKWQLSETPISREDFERLVYLRPGFFHCGLRVVSHPNIDIESHGDLTVTFAGPDDTMLRGRVAEQPGRDDAAQTFVQRDGEQIKLNTSFPHPGNYTLRLYAKKRDETGPYDWAADYLVRVAEVSGEQASFPEMMSTFQECSARLLSPLNGKLKAGSKEEFKLTAPGANAVAVVAGGAWTQLEKHGDAWEGTVTIKGDKTQVAARFPGSASFYILLTYKVGGSEG